MKRKAPWVRTLPWITTIVVVVLEEVLARTGVLPSSIPPFSAVAVATWQMLPTAVFWTSVGQTLAQFAIGLVIGVVAGVVLGVLLGTIPLLQRLTFYTFEFLRFIPAVVYIPILLLLMGARPQLAIILAAVGALWPVMYQTYYGVAGISSILRDTGRVFGLRTGQRLRSIVIPSVSPFLATGLRIAAAHALVVVVAVEIITSVEGLGRDIEMYTINGVIPELYALVFVVGIIGLLVNGLLEFIERRQLHWHPTYRGGQS